MPRILSSKARKRSNLDEKRSQKSEQQARVLRTRRSRTYCETSDEDSEDNLSTSKDTYRGGRSRSSASQNRHSLVEETIQWLSENYELAEGVCLPRCVLYTHYLDFCKKKAIEPSGAATFGKIIRQKFPKVTTRRLGTRGQSKYHYYGIGVKDTSPYYHSVYSKKNADKSLSAKQKGEQSGNNRKFSLHSKTGTLLPEFPSTSNLRLPANVCPIKVETFLMMYRTHCQRVLDTVISANFYEIENFLVHFWKGMPEHMSPVLACEAVIDLVAVCDSILYKVLIEVLIPSSLQDIPESLSEEIKSFANNLNGWLMKSLENTPASLRKAKSSVAHTFVKALQRHISFVHLAQTARTVLLSYDSVSQMLADFKEIDISSIFNEYLYTVAGKAKGYFFVQTFLDEFDNLLSKQSPLEAYTEWIDSVIERCIKKENLEKSPLTFKIRCSNFLTHWSYLTAKILQDLTLQSAASFGCFHLLHMMFEEYVLMIIEGYMGLQMEKDLKEKFRKHTQAVSESVTELSSQSVENIPQQPQEELNHAKSYKDTMERPDYITYRPPLKDQLQIPPDTVLPNNDAVTQLSAMTSRPIPMMTPPNTNNDILNILPLSPLSSMLAQLSDNQRPLPPQRDQSRELTSLSTVEPRDQQTYDARGIHNYDVRGVNSYDYRSPGRNPRDLSNFNPGMDFSGLNGDFSYNNNNTNTPTNNTADLASSNFQASFWNFNNDAINYNCGSGIGTFYEDLTNFDAHYRRFHPNDYLPSGNRALLHTGRNDVTNHIQDSFSPIYQKNTKHYMF